MPAPSKSQIKINALQRLTKEYRLYAEEKEGLETKMHALEQASPVDEYEARRARQVLEETERVMVQVKQGLKSQVEDVQALQGLKPEEHILAHKAVEEASKYVK